MEDGIIKRPPDFQHFEDNSGGSVMVYIWCRRLSCVGANIDWDETPYAAYVSTSSVTNNEAKLVRQGKLLLDCHKCHQPAYTIIAGEEIER